MDTLTIIINELNHQNKSQTELADFLGISKSVFTDWKTGKNQSYLKHINQIAKFLNVSTDYLLNSQEQKEKPIVKGNELSQRDKQLIDLMSSLPDEKFQQVVDFAKYLLEQK